MSKHINLMLGEKRFWRTVILKIFLSNFPNILKLKGYSGTKCSAEWAWLP